MNYNLNSKLTLSLNSQVIELAKVYAKSNKTSLSKLIEFYLSSLTVSGKKQIEITPLVKSLSGLLDGTAENWKKDYGDYLEEKYK
jgi:hypothetical protein